MNYKVIIFLLITGSSFHDGFSQNIVTQNYIKNDKSHLTGNQYGWNIYIEAPQRVLNNVLCVEYTLHKTFRNPIRTVCNRQAKFELRANGWGEFNVKIKITYVNGQVEYFNHWLTLFN